jgi:hypothetical protein
MTRIAPYHHPDDERLSLDYTASSMENARNRIDQYDEDALWEIDRYEFDREVFLVYLGEETLQYANNIELDIFEGVNDMDRANSIITTRILRLFETVIEEKFEQEQEKLSAYKDLEIEDIPNALDHVQWHGPVAQVGGSLVSSLILRHALPNANHRTSIAMLRVYYEAVSSQFDMPQTATDEYDWEPWVDEFIQDSKRLITVRRNSRRFFYLHQAGCNVVERKDGIRIHLQEFDLDMRTYEAQKDYAEQHTDRCIKFAKSVLNQAKNPQLLRGGALNREEFADQIQRME